MNILSRPQRFFWVLGVLLLVGTAAGAGWFFNRNDPTAPQNALPEANFIIAQGHVDLEHGVASLYPVQPGRVTAIYVSENDTVSEGELLLSTDDRFSRQKLKEAAADLEAARQNVLKAELAIQVRLLQIDQQKEKIKALEAGLAAQRQELALKDSLYQNKREDGKPGRPLISKEELAVYQEKVKVEQAKVAAEKVGLRLVQLQNPSYDINRAQQEVKAKEAQYEKARLGLLEHDVYAPADGTILRVMTSIGDLLGPQPKWPVLQFCLRGERIDRAEVQQEWASKIEVGQVAIIEDESRAGYQWQGKVFRVSDWYTHRRSMLQEPFQYNDVRTLECLVSVEPGSRPLRIGQRMRVTIKQGGP